MAQESDSQGHVLGHSPKVRASKLTFGPGPEHVHFLIYGLRVSPYFLFLFFVGLTLDHQSGNVHGHGLQPQASGAYIHSERQSLEAVTVDRASFPKTRKCVRPREKILMPHIHFLSLEKKFILS